MARTRVSGRRSGGSQAQRKAKLSTPGLDALLAAGNKAAEHSKRTGRQSKLPPELQAPITIEIEQQLAQLIQGARRADAADNELQFNDWLCVLNAVDRLARRAEKQPEFPSVTSAKSRSKAKTRRTQGH